MLVVTLCACALSLLARPLTAQWGFPLDGTWSGYWGPTRGKDRVRLLISMKLHVNQDITGFIIEKGVRVPLQSVKLDPSTWTVTMVAERKGGANGRAVKIRVEGKLKHLSSLTDREIVGTWNEGERRGKFRVVMNE